ncbi:condensin-2 complex subunit H2-like [Neltuma alba]|uniref:condensin-2 complex subunit H2-like n=1 Tax=Neltuma alba TaxID=207710 RepID=UPI0010A49061|nr:condensin-2 complex subunit H2-like [Prosopis alba]
MNKETLEPGSSGGGFHSVHAERDLESNWEVNLAKKLEEYLLKICSGEITGVEEEGHISVNFAEAALLLQGSIQVYSRKVEYLYTLVLRALEFLSQKRLQEQLDGPGPSVQPEESGAPAVADEENDQFWCLDDIPVEENISLDSTPGKEVNLNHFVKPPANLVVLEGDCLDATGRGGELESYLLATTNLYHDFILLDTSDAVALNEYLRGNKVGTEQNGAYRGSSNRKSFHSPRGRSTGSAHKNSAAKSQHANPSFTPQHNCRFDADNIPINSPASAGFDNCNNGLHVDEGCDAYPSNSSSDDEDDPWKPLNPHEPGNLRVKPFRKVKAFKSKGVNLNRRVSISSLFPPAKLHGPINPELMNIWESRRYANKQKDSSSPPLYEKLRQSLVNGGDEINGTFPNPENCNDDNLYDSENPDLEVPENVNMDEDMPACSKEYDNGDAYVDVDEAIGNEYPNSQSSLEDLCRSHLDSLLASIAKTEKQTEMAARVSTWKQRIEHNLEEQESHPPFDIHDYGENILDKLSFEEQENSILSFSDVVKGQEKYDVARSFSALLQLVNNGDVHLERSGNDGESVCYTGVNPFHVRLLNHEKKRDNAQLRLTKKRAKSPTKKALTKGNRNKTARLNSPNTNSSKRGLSPPSSNCKFSVKLAKASAIRCTPEGKRRRRSQYVEPINLHSAG